MNAEPTHQAAVADPPPAMLNKTRHAFLANQRQELLEPASALLELTTMLARDAIEKGHEEFLRDQQKARASAEQLLALIQQLLDPATLAAGKDDLARVRHDLRTPLTEIIGLGEWWLEDAPAELLDCFVGDLREVHALGLRLLASLDTIQGFGKIAGDPNAGLDGFGDQIKPILDMVNSLAPVDAKPAAGARITGTILVVDDNATNRKILTRRLKRDGHTVVAAEDGRQALALARGQAFDLILLDIIMPEVNGLEVLTQLKTDTRLRHVPVLMMSSFRDLEGVVHCIDIGAEDYLPKPINPVLLRARIDACLEKKRLRDREVQHLEQLERERRRVNELLHVILPDEIVRELKATNAVLPRQHEDVAVLFADIAGFTAFCDRSRPEEVVVPLQGLIEACEQIALVHGVEKIKTIGDAFMGAAGLLRQANNPVLSCLRCGLEMIAACKGLPTHWEMRVGIHVGPLVAGVIGKRRYQFDLWGDTVNTAARMESSGVPGAVTLSATAWQYVAHCCRGQSRGALPIKGKGQMEMIRFVEFLES